LIVKLRFLLIGFVPGSPRKILFHKKVSRKLIQYKKGMESHIL
jgi:hypothetical protein